MRTEKVAVRILIAAFTLRNEALESQSAVSRCIELKNCTILVVITALRAPVLFSLFLFGCIASPAQSSDSPKVSTINIVVVKEHGGKPVKNAEVVLHMLDKDGNEKRDGLELKTHEDGKTWTDGIPYGKVRIQVIARGFRTWGNDFDVSKPSMDVTIKLQKPRSQFSIYK